MPNTLSPNTLNIDLPKFRPLKSSSGVRNEVTFHNASDHKSLFSQNDLDPARNTSDVCLRHSSTPRNSYMFTLGFRPIAAALVAIVGTDRKSVV